MSQGESMREKIADDSRTPENEGNPFLNLCRHIQSPQHGRNASIEGLASAPTPHKPANITHPLRPRHPCNSSATKKIRLKISGVNVVSQIQWIDQYQM